MTAAAPAENSRDVALQKIGRNVVNFQKIESLLKVLVLWSKFGGTAQTLRNNLAKREKSIRKRPMGQLADTLHSNIYGLSDTSEQHVDPLAISISSRFYFELDADEATIQKKGLENLIAERNSLIHKDLGNFDFGSSEDCRNLIIKLDEQHDRILNQLEQLKGVWAAFNVMRKEILAFMATDEFLEIFEREQNGI